MWWQGRHLHKVVFAGGVTPPMDCTVLVLAGKRALVFVTDSRNWSTLCHVLHLIHIPCHM